MTLSLKLEEDSAVPEQELAGFRSAVLEWARSASRLDPGALEGQLRIRAARRIPVYDLTLQSLIETREVLPDPVVQPWEEGMVTADRPLPYDKIRIWDIVFEAPAEFKDAKAGRLVPETLTVKDCVECRGEGAAPCAACNGEGRSLCVECRGRGKKACESCHGLGKSNCLRCNGRGLKEGSTLLLSGEDACPLCKGDGKVPCGRCEHGEMPCGFCESMGRRPCSQCGASGKRGCQVCQGRGRTATGYVCKSEFKVVRNMGVAPAVPVPAPVLGALAGFSDPSRPVQSCDGDFTEEEVRRSPMPEALQKEISRLLEKGRVLSSPRGRPVRQRLTVGKEEVVQVTGAFDALELVCWYLPKSQKIIPETNPFQNLVGAAWEQAQRAAAAGDWDAAEAMAKKTLAYDPAHVESRQLMDKRKNLILRDTLIAAAAAGLTSAVSAASLIFFAEKGLHKTGPAIQAAVTLALLGPLLGLALHPLARKFPKPKTRRGATFGGTLAVLLAAAAVARGPAGWDGVRAADAAAFREELKASLPMGVSDVFWAADLQALRDLESRYARTRVDLTEIRRGIEKQERLKAELDRLTEKYQAGLRAVLDAGGEMGLQERIAKLGDLIEAYKVHGVDVSAAERSLAEARDRMKSAPAASSRPRRTVLKIESVPAPAVSVKKKAKASKAAPAKKKVPKKKYTRPNFEPWNTR